MLGKWDKYILQHRASVCTDKRCRQTDRRTDIWAEKRIARQTDRHTDKRFVRQTDRKTESKWTDMDGKMDRQKDGLWQTYKKFPKQAERKLEGQTGTSKADMIAMQTGLPCRHVCHADMFAMQTDLPCRHVCHANRFAMQTCRKLTSTDR